MAPQVAYKDNTIALEEGLPFPHVYYPGHYGAFIGFREKMDEDSPITFCECMRPAIWKYITMRAKEPARANVSPEKAFILSSQDFPWALVHHLLMTRAPNDERILDHLAFKHLICHRCNEVEPAMMFCSKQSGGTRRRTFGWYERAKALERRWIPPG